MTAIVALVSASSSASAQTMHATPRSGPTWEAVRTPRAVADVRFLRDIDGVRFFMAPDASLLADEVFFGYWCFTLANARVARTEQEAKGDGSARHHRMRCSPAGTPPAARRRVGVPGFETIARGVRVRCVG